MEHHRVGLSPWSEQRTATDLHAHLSHRQGGTAYQVRNIPKLQSLLPQEIRERLLNAYWKLVLLHSILQCDAHVLWSQRCKDESW